MLRLFKSKSCIERDFQESRICMPYMYSKPTCGEQKSLLPCSVFPFYYIRSDISHRNVIARSFL